MFYSHSRSCLLGTLGMGLAMSWMLWPVHAAQSNSYTSTNTNNNSNINTETNTVTNTNTSTNTNNQTCNHNGVLVDCKTRKPIPTSSNPGSNCPERRNDWSYGIPCDHKIPTLKFRAVKIQHGYGRAGFDGGRGLSEAYAMNDNAAIVGQAVNSKGEKHAVQITGVSNYGADHYFTDLGSPKLISDARAINNEHTVVGSSQYAVGSMKADAIFVGSATLKTLGVNVGAAKDFARILMTLGGNVGVATDLARNQRMTEYVAGYGIWPKNKGGDDREHGFVWSIDNEQAIFHRIGNPGERNLVEAINDSRIAVGFMYKGGVKSAFRWNYGPMKELPDYGNYESAALDINNNLYEKIVGYAKDSRGKKRAALWDYYGNLTSLQDLPGRSGSEARAITDGGDIVGESGALATLWREDVAYDFNVLIEPRISATLTTAIDMNRQGFVLTKANDNFFYVLVPIEQN